MTEEKTDQWSDAGKLMGRAMLLIAPVTAVFTIGVAWSQLADRQDRLRRDMTEMQLMSKDVITDLNNIKLKVTKMDTYLDTSGPDFERRIMRLETKVINGDGK